MSLLGYAPGIGQHVKVNDTWLEVVWVLYEELVSDSQSSGGAMQDINNLRYIPLNTVQYRFWDQSYSMKDDLDGIELRLKPEADSIDVAKGGDVGAVEHAPQRPGFYGDDPGGALGAVAADADALQVRDGGDRGDLAAGGRDRDHEHRAGDGASADAADRHSAGRPARGGWTSCGSS